MKMLICAVYDAAVRAYNTPLAFRSKPEAVRSFADAVNGEQSQFKRHAADYHLAILGEFDDNSGVIVSLPAPERLISAVECIVDNELFPPGKQLPS